MFALCPLPLLSLSLSHLVNISLFAVFFCSSISYSQSFSERIPPFSSLCFSLRRTLNSSNTLLTNMCHNLQQPVQQTSWLPPVHVYSLLHDACAIFFCSTLVTHCTHTHTRARYSEHALLILVVNYVNKRRHVREEHSGGWRLREEKYNPWKTREKKYKKKQTIKDEE